MYLPRAISSEFAAKAEAEPTATSSATPRLGSASLAVPMGQPRLVCPTMASAALIASAAIVRVLLPAAPEGIAAPPGKNRFEWSWARQSGSTTDVFASLPMIVPPIMCWLGKKPGTRVTFSAPSALANFSVMGKDADRRPCARSRQRRSGLPVC